MQTSSQAVDAVLRGRPRDYVPLYDSPWGDTLRKWVLQGMPADDVARRVGLVNAARLSRLFRQRRGVGLGQWRRLDGGPG